MSFVLLWLIPHSVTLLMNFLILRALVPLIRSLLISVSLYHVMFLCEFLIEANC